MSDSGGIYIPWYIYTACGVVWLLALVGLGACIRMLVQFSRKFGRRNG